MKHKKLDNIKTSGFKVPKDYFSQVEANILGEVHLKNRVEHSGFEVPDSYFEILEDTILKNTTVKADVKVISFFNGKKVLYAAIAAAACLILMFNVFFNTSEELTFDSLDIASIEDYIVDENYTSYELSELLDENDLNEDHFIDTKITQDQLDDYLLNNSNIEELIIE